MAHYFLGNEGTVLIERRSIPRQDIALDVAVRVAGDTPWMHGITTNLSEAGMQIVVPGAIPEGSVVEFSFPSFSGSARAVWVRDEGQRNRVGFSFTSLSASGAAALRALLSRGLTPAESGSVDA